VNSSDGLRGATFPFNRRRSPDREESTDLIPYLISKVRRARAHLLLALVLSLLPAVGVAAQVMGDPVDVSQEFQKMEQNYFVGSRVKDFDAATGQGTLQWDRYLRSTTLSFNKIDVTLTRGRATEFPGTEYDQDPVLPFSISFVTPRTIRLRFTSRSEMPRDSDSLMLVGTPPVDHTWKVEQTDKGVTYTSAYGQVRLIKDPWHIEFYDSAGRLLTRTQTIGDPATYFTPIPFSFVRRATSAT
jgi:alpha-D-xyloside xylohydrolase